MLNRKNNGLAQLNNINVKIIKLCFVQRKNLCTEFTCVK